MTPTYESIFQIIRYPDPLLKGPFKPVDEDFAIYIRSIMPKLEATIKAHKAYGLAAPQVGFDRTFLLIDLSTDPKNEDYPQNKKIICVCNPQVISMDEPTIQSEEGCLSLPGVKIKVPRKSYCHVKYRDEFWQEKAVVFTGLEAIIFQHEFDHLQGTLLLDKISRLKRQMAIKRMHVVTKRNQMRW